MTKFEKWYSKNKTQLWISFPWIKDELEAAFKAGQKSMKPKLERKKNPWKD